MLRLITLVATPCLLSLATARVWADPPGQLVEPLRVVSDGVPELGVVVVDSPGVGVLVQSVIAGLPAEAMGITSGDFIMAIDGQAVNEPRDLSASIQSKVVGSTVAIDVWRDGQQVTKQTQLTASSPPLQPAGRAWLGVRLRSTGQDGARIEVVVPGSPAARAQLLAGDNITMIGDTAVVDASDLVNAVSSHKPGDTVPVTVVRDGQELSFKVEFGSAADKPRAFSFRLPFGDGDAFTFPLKPMIPIPLEDGREFWMPSREEFQNLKRELDNVREQLRKATGEESESPAKPPIDVPIDVPVDPEVTPSDDDT